MTVEVIDEREGPSKYDYGRIHVVLFDRQGQRLRTEVQPPDALLADTLAAYRAKLSDDDKVEYATFVVMRVMHNSADSKKWEVKNG